MLACDRTIGERAQHVIVRHARHVTGRVETGDGGAGEFVDEHAGRTMARAEADFRNMHLDHALAIIGAAVLVEAAARGPLDGVENRLDLADRVAVQMVELEEHRTLAGLQFAVELLHHLPGPVVAFDEAPALAVGRICTERAGDIGAGRAVIVLDQRIDLVAFEIREPRTGVIGHGIAVA